MKPVIFLALLLFAYCTAAFCQCPPAVLKIETPTCEAPKDLSIKRINCDTLIVKWQGNVNQSYLIKLSGTDSLHHQTITQQTNKYQCNANGSCRAAFPVKQGVTIDWSVQAICNINSTILYSYTVEGKQVNIPYCSTIANNKISGTANNNSQLVVYPNPSFGYLKVDYASKENGIAEISISDVTGKPVFSQSYKVRQNINHYQMNLRQLQPGIYILSLKSGEEAKYVKFTLLGK